MNIIENILSELRGANAQVFVDGDNLRVDSRKGAIDDKLKSLIKTHKESLIHYVRQIRTNDQLTIPEAEIQDSYVLSSAQKRLWILCQLNDANIAYNMTGVYVLEGGLDYHGLGYCFRELAGRHEILRTIFRENASGEVRQYIRPVEAFGTFIEYTDIRLLEQQEMQLKELIEAEGTRPFDLGTGPLFRVHLYRTGEARWVLIYSMHHIISDGWSMRVLIRELFLLYQAYFRGDQGTLAPLRIQYKDYAVWQQTLLNGDRLAIHRDYWRRQLRGDLPVLDLPGDRARPAIRTYNGKVISRTLGPELTSALRHLCQENGCTLFMGLLGLVNTLLFRYTGQKDLIIGSPIAGRGHAELEGQIGFYVNMLALRTQLEETHSFVDVLKKTREVTLGAYEHQIYPFDELVEELWHSGDRSRHAFFDVVVVLHNLERERAGGEGNVRVEDYRGAERVVSLFDLRFEFWERDNGLDAVIEYNTDIYDEARIVRIHGHLGELLSSVLRTPVQDITTLPYLTIREKELLLAHEGMEEEAGSGTNGGRVHRTLVELFEEQVNKGADRISVTKEGEQLSYGELNIRANRIANFLIGQAGIQKGEGVGLLLDRTPECIAAILGILKAGGMYVPMDIETPEERLLYMIRDAGVRVLITEKSVIELMNRLQWSAGGPDICLCVDTTAVREEKEVRENLMMNKELWDHVGENAVDAITGGGWTSSYTGEALSEAEMEEYALNAYAKLSPLLNQDLRVLEIGCSSGLTMRKIAPHVGHYHGTDLSPVIVENSSRMAASEGWRHVKVECMAAHEMEKLAGERYGLIILNSVIQHFHGHNYLRRVLKDAIALLDHEGHIFIGDVMDIELKEALIQELEAFKKAARGRGDVTKTDLSAELFVAKGFFEDMVIDETFITGLEIGEKIHTISNELTKYRYDVILKINKDSKTNSHKGSKKKFQFDRGVLEGQPENNPCLALEASDLAYTIYTSGTTGRPKGVLIGHRNVTGLLEGCGRIFNIGMEDVWTMFHSYSFDFSVWELFGALANGGRIVLVPKATAQDPELYLSLLRREKVTILNQTPSAFYQLDRCEREVGAEPLALRYVIFGGEALEAGRLADWKHRHPEVLLVNMYGITETTVHVTYKEIGKEDIRRGGSPIGKPIPGWTCYVLDGQGQLLPAGLPGELYIGGRGVGKGYLRRPELTTERFKNNPFRAGDRLYRSGDKVMIRQDGQLEYMGRVDDQVKIRGYRIELGEIGHALSGYGSVESSTILARENAQGERELVAYLVSSVPVDVSDLRSYLGKILPVYMIPSHYVLLDKLPLTANGKIDRKRLPSPEAGEMADGAIYEAPRTGTEKKLACIWEQILGKERVGIKDDFFELGGHSLKATRLANQIHKEFSVKIALRELFSHTVLQQQAGLIDAAKTTDYDPIEPVAGRSGYVLSSAQRRLWIMSQLKEGNAAYNISGSYLLQGVVDPEALSTCFDRLVERHEILRTNFRINEEDDVLQYVQPAEGSVFKMGYTDLREMEEPENRLKDLIQEEMIKPFDLSQGSLLRAELYRADEYSWVLTCTMHHIISDGWSIGVMTGELMSLYRASRQGQPYSPSPLRIQYKDYAAWQQEQLKNARMKMHRDYWLRKLGGDLPVLELTGDRVRPAVKTYNGAIVEKWLSGELVGALRRLIRKRGQGYTLFMGLLGLVKILLYRYTGQKDILVGSPIAGRLHADLANQIGFYLNTLVLRTTFNDEDSFMQLLPAIRDTTIEAYEHQDYPFDELIEQLELKRDLSRNPLFDILVALQNVGMDDHGNGHTNEELRMNPYKGGEMCTSRMDLSWNFVEAGEDIYLSIEFNSDIFDVHTVRRMADHLEGILKAVVCDPDVAIGALDYMDVPEKQALLDNGRAVTGSLDDKTIVELFEEQAARTPTAIALAYGDISLTYEDLNEQANQLGHYLRQRHEIKPNELIGMMLPRSQWMIISLLGILKSGGVYVPIDPDYPRDRIDFILSDSSCKVVIDEQLLTRFRQNADLYSKKDPEKVNDVDHLAYVIYTSGSTGKPKGVMIGHGAISSFFQRLGTGMFNL